MASMTELITPKQQAEIGSAVERIGAFAFAARPEHLTTDIRQLFKRNILDSIACAIAAVAGPSLRSLRDQIEEYRAPGRCTLIGGGKTSPDQAALFNSALVRYVDLLDSYMAQGGLCQLKQADLSFGPNVFAVNNAAARGHPLHFASVECAALIAVKDRAVENESHGFKTCMRVRTTQLAGRQCQDDRPSTR
jgi:2-methylcitrate dehydratase